MPIPLDEFNQLADESTRGSKVANEELLEYLGNLGCTTKEVAEFLGVQNGTAYNRLKRLEENELVQRKFKGNLGYWTAV